MFTLVLNLEHTHPNAIGRIELPLFHGDIEIEIYQKNGLVYI